MYKKIEESISLKVATFIKLQYPNINYRFDTGADIKLTMGQAIKFKALQMKKRGYPDLLLLNHQKAFTGFILKLKKI